jgi:cellulose synthase operon protein C
MASERISVRTLSATLALLAGLVSVAAPAAEVTDKARAYLERGDLRAATIELKSALQKNPNDATARLLLARLYLRVGNGAGAEKEIRSAIDLGAAAALWRLDFVEALIAQGKFDDAVQRLDAATDLSSADQVRVLTLRGDAALGQNRPDEARARYQEALAADPASERAGLGTLRVALKEGDQAAAIKATDGFLERFPNNTEALLIRAVTSQ